MQYCNYMSGYTYVGIHTKICLYIYIYGASLVAQLVKNPPKMQETPVQFLGQKDPLEKG